MMTLAKLTDKKTKQEEKMNVKTGQHKRAEKWRFHERVVDQSVDVTLPH